MKIGEKIRDRRIALGLTQEELATRAEMTKGFISQLERDLTSPAIDSLTDILEALGTDLATFFKEEEQEKIVFSDEDAFENEDELNGIIYKWVVPNSQKNSMEPIIMTINPSGSTQKYLPVEAEEFCYVIKGKVEFIYGDNKYSLKK